MLPNSFNDSLNTDIITCSRNWSELGGRGGGEDRRARQGGECRSPEVGIR